MLTAAKLIQLGKLPTANSAQNMLNGARKFIPNDPHNPLPLTWKDAVRLPGNNIFKRILWACLMMDALRADAARLHTMGIEVEEPHRPKQRNPNNRNPEGELDAGEVDEFGNGPQVADEEEDDPYVLNNHAGAIDNLMRRIYADSFEEVKEKMGIAGAEDLTDEALNKWVAENEHTPAFKEMTDHILNEVANEHGFNLNNVELAHNFINRMTELAFRAGKGVPELKTLGEGLIGKAFNNHLNQLSAFADRLENAAKQGLRSIGASVTAPLGSTPTPTPQPSLQNKINQNLTGMGAPNLSNTVETRSEQETTARLNQIRLATLQAMYPNIQAQNAQHTALGNQAASHATNSMVPKPEPHSPEQVAQELEHAAKTLGVGVTTLGKAIDKVLIEKIWPDQPGVKADMQNNPLVATPVNKPKTAVQQTLSDAMHPNPYNQGKK